MNCFKFFLLIVFAQYPYQVRSKKKECNFNITEPFGLRFFQSEETHGDQKCFWDFIPENNHEDFMLIVQVADFEGKNSNNYVGWPDGSQWRGDQNNDFLPNTCLKFVKTNGKSKQCLEKISDQYCPGKPVAIDNWPPKIGLNAFGQKGIDRHPYLFFEILYVMLFCEDSTQLMTDVSKLNEFTTTTFNRPSNTIAEGNIGVTAVAGIFALLFLICLTVVLMLLHKQRVVTKSRKSRTSNAVHNASRENPSYREVGQLESSGAYSSDVQMRTQDSAYTLAIDPPITSHQASDYDVTDPEESTDTRLEHQAAQPEVETSIYMLADGPAERNNGNPNYSVIKPSHERFKNSTLSIDSQSSFSLAQERTYSDVGREEFSESASYSEVGSSTSTPSRKPAMTDKYSRVKKKKSVKNVLYDGFKEYSAS